MSGPPVITLTTDFGLSDPYVAAMKGVILSLDPRAVLLDVSHDVQPQRVEQGAFLLELTLPYLPPNAIHLAVVDPGVGTERRALAIQGANGTFVGPDNGLLSAALPADSRAGLTEPRPVALTEGLRAVSLEEPRFHRRPVSETFHGRDIFAPVAAHLSLGTPLSDLGPPVVEMLALPLFRAPRGDDGILSGHVLHVDRFGNLITDLRSEDLPSRPTVEVSGRRIEAVARTYGTTQGLSAIIGSAGYLEIAMPGGSAAAELAVAVGQPLIVRPSRGR